MNNDDWQESPPARAEIDAFSGPSVIEFGSPGCGYCIAASPLVAQVMEAHPEVRHLRVADGKGRPLGRSFQVKLWPTLIFLNNGQEVARVVRPESTDALSEAMALLIAGG